MAKRRQIILIQDNGVTVVTPYGDIEILVDEQATVIELSTANVRGSRAELVEFTQRRFRVHVYRREVSERLDNALLGDIE
jgi:hypothetical protein